MLLSKWNSDINLKGHSTKAERNMFIAERFIQGLVNKYGKHPISTDGGTCICKPADF
jgi:hypothetical protein